MEAPECGVFVFLLILTRASLPEHMEANLVFAGAVIRTVVDYSVNRKFYFNIAP